MKFAVTPLVLTPFVPFRRTLITECRPQAEETVTFEVRGSLRLRRSPMRSPHALGMHAHTKPLKAPHCIVVSPLAGGTKRATSVNEHTTSAPAELGGEIHIVSRNRARTQVLLQARKLHVYGSGTSGAFWPCCSADGWVTLSSEETLLLGRTSFRSTYSIL